MSKAIEYKTPESQSTQRVSFNNPQACLPVIRKDGGIELVSWGRRETDSLPLELNFPVTGWAKIEDLWNKRSFWYRYRFKEARVPAYRFMLRGDTDQPYWFTLAPEEYLRAIVVIIHGQWRVYLITTEAPRDLFERFPCDFQQDLFGDGLIVIDDRFPLIGTPALP